MAERSAASATATMTVTDEGPQSEENVVYLRLRPKPHVKWSEKVIDNEGLGKKKSNKCCIFHKQREFGESSSEDESSSSDDDSDSGSDTGEWRERLKDKLKEIEARKQAETGGGGAKDSE